MAHGSVKRAGAGWMFVVDLPSPTGRRRQVRRRGFATRKAAEKELRELLGQADAGTFVEPSKQTVAVFLAEWIEMIRPTVRPSTWASYERDRDHQRLCPSCDHGGRDGMITGR